MKIEINEFINAEIVRQNKLFQHGAKISGKSIELFTVKDYPYLQGALDYFGEFSVPYFLSYSVLKDVEYRIKNPYPGTIWYWKKDADKNTTKDFLPTQSKLLYDTLNAYISLLKSGNHLQALILFRSYIEYSSQFYAALLDYDFFRKYTGSELLEEEYKKLWFNTLKPAKVLSQIKAMHAEIDQLLKENKIYFGKNMCYSRIFRPFDSYLRGKLYTDLSALAHGSYPALIKEDETKLYALVWLCSVYLVQSQVVIDELTSVYFQYSTKELFTKWITVEIYLKSVSPQAMLFMQKNGS